MQNVWFCGNVVGATVRAECALRCAPEGLENAPPSFQALSSAGGEDKGCPSRARRASDVILRVGRVCGAGAPCGYVIARAR